MDFIRIRREKARFFARLTEKSPPLPCRPADELYQQVDELATKLGPEYIALMDGLQDMDPDSEDGKEIGSTLDVLNKLCAK